MLAPVGLIYPEMTTVTAQSEIARAGKDDYVRQMPAGYILVDADDGGTKTLNKATTSGRSLIGGYPWNWAGGTDIAVIDSEPTWNNRAVFNCIGSFHMMTVRGAPTPSSYLISIVASVPQSVLDALAARTSGFLRYLFSGYNQVLVLPVFGLHLFTTPFDYGWAWLAGNGNSGNIFQSQHPDAFPTQADKPFVITIEVDAVNGVTDFYFGDATTPKVSFTHSKPLPPGNGGPAMNFLNMVTNFVDGDQVVLPLLAGGSKTYIGQSVLTNVNGHFLIGADLPTSLANYTNCVNGTGGVPGVDYAAATTAHPDLVATSDTVSTVTVASKVGGGTANGFACTTTMPGSRGAWKNPVLYGGGETRLMPFSVSIGGNSASWEGKGNSILVHNDDVIRCPDALRIGHAGLMRSYYTAT